MSLQVWLPLNGNLNNQGLSNAEIIATGATVNTSGKIGSCYSFDGSDDLISINCPDLYKTFSGGSQQFSIAFWIYHADATRAIIFGDYGLTGAIGFNIELTTGHQIRFYWNGSPDKNFAAAAAVAASGWTHIVLTYNGSKVNIYKNGILQSDNWSGTLAIKNKTSGLFYLGRDSRTGTTVLNGRLNDFRIYNHTLSVKEVEEISKGLILHYKLDNNGLGGKNLFRNTNFYKTATQTTAATTSIPSLTFTENLQNLVGKTITFSFELYTPGARQNGPNGGSLNGRFGSHLSLNYTPSGGSATQAYPCASNLTTTISEKGYRVAMTYTVPSNCTINSFSMAIQPYAQPASGNTETWFFGYPKVEYGDKATPYSQAPEDYGDQNIIYDSSGYQHNGDLIGIITNSVLAPRYNISTHFINGSYGRIQEKPSICLPTDAITVNLWIRIDTWGNPISCTEGGGWNFENSSGIQFPVYVASVGYKIANSGVTPTTLGNTWHMLTGTFDKENVKIYIDSILKKTTATGSTNPIGYANNYLFLAAEASGNNTSPANSTFVGDLSDLRIYCTALTENQIKELYDTSATIDKNGNIYAREVIE